VHEVRGRSVLECRMVRVGADGPQVHRGRSVSEQTVRGSITDDPLLRVQYWRSGAYFRMVHRRPADSPPRPRGRSAPPLRIVRQVPCRAAKSFASWVALSLRDCLGLVPRVGRSVVTTWPWQACVGILGCEFGAGWARKPLRFRIRAYSLGRVHPLGRIFISSHSLPPLWSPNRSFNFKLFLYINMSEWFW
jgi:hypothetical protein